MLKTTLGLAAFLLLFPVLTHAQLRGWSYLGALYGGIRDESICVDSAGAIYVADSLQHLLHRTTDDGKTWIDAPNYAAIGIWAAPSGTLITSGYEGEYRSTDHGQTWNIISSLPATYAYINAIAFTASGNFVAATREGIMISTNDGANWNQATGLNINAVGVISIGHDSLFATANGVYLSSDGGTRWAKDSSYPNKSYPGTIASDSKHDVFVLDSITIYERSAQFPYWVPLTPGVNGMGNAYAMRVLDDKLVITIANDSIQISSDGGNTWQSPLPVPGIGDPRMSEDKTGGWVLIASSGIFRSFDEGHTWHSFGEMLGKADISAFYASPDGMLYAGTDNTGIARSTDGGFHWSYLAPVGRQNTIRKIASRSPSDIVTMEDGLLFESRDGGNSWQQLPALSDWIGDFAFDRTGRIFATSGLRVYALSPDSAQWTRLNIPTDFATQFAIAVDSANNYYAIAQNSNNAFWRSTDRGVSWTEKIPRDVYSVGVSPHGEVVASVGQSLEVSSNSGATWTYATNPGGSYLPSPSFRANNTLFFPLQDGIYESTDLGSTWTVADSSIPAQGIVESRGRLIAATSNGVFGEGVTNWVRRTKEEGANIFPNPVTTGKLRIASPKAISPGPATIVNASGVIVRTTVTELTSDGLLLDVRSLSPGAYTCRLSSNSRTPATVFRFIIP